MTTITYIRDLADIPAASRASIIAACDAAITAGADDWQAPAGWEPGDHDGQWDHPAAEQARQLTAAAGLQWEFTNWRDLRDSLRAIV